jgi:hypothetical protein
MAFQTVGIWLNDGKPGVKQLRAGFALRLRSAACACCPTALTWRAAT